MCTGIVGLEGMVCSRRLAVEVVGDGGKGERLVTALKRKPSCSVGRGREERVTCSKDSVTRSKDLLRQCVLALSPPRTVAMVTEVTALMLTFIHHGLESEETL